MKLSVTQLVEFACRGGDLVHTGLQGPTAREGMRAHQKVQQALSEQFESEVRISCKLTVDDQLVTLGGRIDLLNPATINDTITVREIKSTLVPSSRIPDSIKLQHWAQLKVYAYCYLYEQHRKAGDDSPANAVCELQWVNLLDQSEVVDTELHSFEVLEKFTTNALRKYLAWWNKIDHWRKQLQSSAQTLAFPYPDFRAGQRDMAAATYRAIRDAHPLLCEAPTGIGKTLSTLFPALKAAGEGHVTQLVYLTAKTSGRNIALDAVKQLRQSGLQTTVLLLHSKVRICHCTNGTCERNADGSCPLTIGFFDRLPQAMDTLLDLAVIDETALNTAATRYQVCPFELSLQMLPWVSIVICDYNYVFDPLVRLSRFSESNREIVLLVDEAHNLVDRARGMYSACLTRSQNRQAERDCQLTHPGLARSLKGLSRALDRWAAQHDESEFAVDETPVTVTRAVNKCLESISNQPEQSPPLPESMLEWFKELFRYRVIEELFTTQHRTVTRVSDVRGRKQVEVRLLCTNASDWLTKSYKLFRSTIAFSATLRPQGYFHTALGLPESTTGMVLPSPFAAEQLGVFVCPYIDTRFRNRKDSIEPLVQVIHNVTRLKTGNYLVFFPSYAYLEQVFHRFVQCCPDQSVLVQERDFSVAERDQFLQNFSEQRNLIGFAIMGGVFGEGIDYLGDQLIGCIVVGTGLPGISMEQNLIAESYANEGLDGFDYAFRFPGFTRVLQTSGRVIRTESDRGVVVLVDNRFQSGFYRALFPEHWQIRWCKENTMLDREVESFWLKRPPSEGSMDTIRRQGPKD